MSVEQKIIDNSELPIKGLAPRAAKAMKAPDTGVKILIPGAANVIRDCATIATKYLPILLYGSFTNPITALRGKITRSEFEALIIRGETQLESKQLLTLMLLDAKKESSLANPISTIQTPNNTENPYGDYDNYTQVEDNTVEMLNDIDVLCKAFETK